MALDEFEREILDLRPHSMEWNAELLRQIKRHDLDPMLWICHFGSFGILPEDPEAVCDACPDRRYEVCELGSKGDPLRCMKRRAGRRVTYVEVYG